MGSCRSEVSEDTDVDAVNLLYNNYVNPNRQNTCTQPSAYQRKTKMTAHVSFCSQPNYPQKQKISSNCIAINAHEFIVCSAYHLYKHNIYNHKWSVYKSFPLGFNKFICDGSCTMSLDKKSRLLYILNTERQLLILNLRIQKAVASGKKRIDYKLYPQKYELLGNQHASSIFVNNTLHVIGGSVSNKHFIFNAYDKYQRFQEVHRFKEYRHKFSSHALVHIQSQNKLLLFGGKEIAELDTIYSFCLFKFKWTKLSTTLPCATCNLSAVVSGDDSCVVLFAGFKTNYSLIWIMDTQTFAFRKSSIDTTHYYADEFCRLHAVLMDHSELNEVLVYGYLRRLWEKASEGNDLRFISDDSICIILRMYGDDDVHVLREREHYKMKLNSL